ncbi:MAG TPA: hypothetical protein VEP30_04030 [Chthoniobacterales bacterium]|nr:hypothetical protein [Chthoniobacterales bacterium]
MKRLWKFLRRALVLLLLCGGVGTAVFVCCASRLQKDFAPINDAPPPAAVVAVMNQTPKYRRPEDASYLSFPEWYLVFCPQEYAEFLRDHRPSQFPYFKSIGQLWNGYAQVYGITHRRYRFNFGDHLTMAIIATSSTVEFGIKGAYDATVGRFFEWISGTPSAEDVYAAQVAKEYGDFIPTQPWYDFPFGHKLGGLWSTTGFFGPHFLRKCERKIFLSCEYALKSIYAGVIRLASHSVYGIADTEVYASVHKIQESAFADRQVKKIKQIDDDTCIITVPHYQGFTDTVPTLARQGVQFDEIAGNDEILLTLIAPAEWNYDLTAGHPLFIMSLLTGNSRKRVAVQAPVKSLSQILQEMDAKGLKLEHLFDY